MRLIIFLFIIFIFIFLTYSFSNDETEATYLGVAKCKPCHIQIYNSWVKTPHANAYKALKDKAKVSNFLKTHNISSLIPEEAPKSPDCVQCHTTGFELKGGFDLSKPNNNLINITCESCHGPGSSHYSAKKDEKAKFIVRKPDEKVCLACHTKEMSPDFFYDEYLKKGVHEIVKK